MIHVDSSVYEGMWLNGKANGNGLFTYADGSYYDGEWSNNKYHG